MSDYESIVPTEFNTYEEWENHELHDQKAIRGAFYGLVGLTLGAAGVKMNSYFLLAAGAGVTGYGFGGALRHTLANIIRFDTGGPRVDANPGQTDEIFPDRPGETI